MIDIAAGELQLARHGHGAPDEALAIGRRDHPLPRARFS
jgi:hypothetical protein